MDASKATYKYTNQSKSKYSYNHCGDDKKKAMLGIRATNDEAESSLGGFKIAGQKEPELRWCQGEVIAVLDRKKPTVRVLWDEMADCSGWETSQEGDCVLLPSKWNKDNEGAWRMDLPVDIEDTLS